MTIAGSDSGAGAGIQADLKTFAAFGVYGVSALTAITAQNTEGVQRVLGLPPEMVAAQIDSIVSDIGAGAVKTGMLGTAEIIRVVAEKVLQHGLQRLVVDPVMVAASGDRLLEDDAIETYRSVLLPLAAVVTPNIPEAEALSGIAITSPLTVRAAAKKIHGLGPKYVLVKGGHLGGSESNDVLFDGSAYRDYPGKRLETASTHGTGCTLASAIAAGLARGRPIAEAVAIAKIYVTEAMRAAFPIGRGRGPLSHLYAWWAAGGSNGLGG